MTGGAGACRIVGAALATPLGDDVETVWQAAERGERAPAPDPDPRIRALSGADGAPWLARLAGLDERDDEEDPALRVLGAHGRLLEAVLPRSHRAAGLAHAPGAPVGLFLATGMVDAEPADLARAIRAAQDEAGALDLRRYHTGAFRQTHPLWPLSMLANVAGGQLAIDLDLRGDGLVLGSEADAGLRALLEAARSTRAGHVGAALAGASAEPIAPGSLARQALRGGVAATSPGALGAPLALAEGAVSLAVLPEAPAGAGAPPDLRLVGGASAFARAEGGGVGREAWRRVIAKLLAGGTPALVALNDASPGSTAVDVLRESLGDLPLMAGAALLGHLGPAAGLADLVLCAQALRTRRLPAALAAEGHAAELPADARRAWVLAGGWHGGVTGVVLEAA